MIQDTIFHEYEEKAGSFYAKTNDYGKKAPGYLSQLLFGWFSCIIWQIMFYRDLSRPAMAGNGI